MSYVSLYRRFRPDSFDKVVGQDHIIKTLTNQVASGKISHAYLFSGARGTGKTSVAKIFAKAVNCIDQKNGSPCGVCSVCKALQSADNLDVIEIDAASNNGVDEIRELNDSVKFKPSIGKYKVYIIDEVHMLSPSAFNAFLKTLEEPPEHIIFCLATTEIQKLPATILSRCMRFDFRLIAKEKIAAIIKDIYQEVGFECDAKGIDLIAMHGEGSVRDALSIADMALSYGGESISYNELLFLLGSTDKGVLHCFAQAILEGDTGAVLNQANECHKKGISPINLCKDLAEYFSQLMRAKNISRYNLEGYAWEEEALKMRELSLLHDNLRIGRAMDIIGNLEGDLRYSLQPQILLEAALIQASELATYFDTYALAARVAFLEDALKEGKLIVKENKSKITLSITKEQDMATQKSNNKESTQAIMGKDNISAEVEIFSNKSIDDRTAEGLFSTKTIGANDARETLAKLVVKLAKDPSFSLLKTALANEDDVVIKDGKLIVKTDNRATFLYLSEKSNIALLNTALKEIADLQLECVEKGQTVYENGKDFMGKMKMLFPDELVVDDKKR